MKKLILILVAMVLALYGASNALAQTSTSVLYIPLIGITSVPDPLTLPSGGGEVTYHYAVKDFLQEASLTDVQVSDNACSPVTYVTGDDNHNGQLDYDETWRYACTTTVTTTTQSTAMAIGTADGITATHRAYATVILGSSIIPPLVSIINITKIAYPVSLPVGGGPVTFTYKVNNPGVVPLSDVTVNDDKCSPMSGHLGDTNNNGLLDANEVWIYTCTTTLRQTTTNTVVVTGLANGLNAVDSDTITVNVATSSTDLVPGLPNTGTNPNNDIAIWEISGAVLAVLIVSFFLNRKKSAAQ